MLTETAGAVGHVTATPIKQSADTFMRAVNRSCLSVRAESSASLLEVWSKSGGPYLEV